MRFNFKNNFCEYFGDKKLSKKTKLESIKDDPLKRNPFKV